MLLLSGGTADPNLEVLETAASAGGIEVRTVRHGAQRHPRLHWELGSDTLLLDDVELAPSGVFARHDVFGWLADRRPAVAWRAEAWHATICGWLRAHPSVRWLNRHAEKGPGQKPADLMAAAHVGLQIPDTRLGNDRDRLVRLEDAVVKPVGGGAACRPLQETLPTAPHRGGALAAPALVQERLRGPDLRVFLVAGQSFAFRSVARTLDVREDPAARPIFDDAVEAGLIDALRDFVRARRLDWTAIDLKLDPDRGPVFLEANRQPMFAAYDGACDGALTRSLLAWHLSRDAPRWPQR